jgi:hypothetical protein
MLFAAQHEMLLSDLTSTYFESPPPEDAEEIRRFGDSRDERSDCVQVVIALIIGQQCHRSLQKTGWTGLSLGCV